MHRPLVVSALFFFLLLSGCSGSDTAQRPYQADPSFTFAPDLLRDDAREFFAIIEEVHPAGDSLAKDPRFRAAQQEAFRRLDHPMTRLEFYRITAPVAALIGDGHTGLWVPTDEFSRLRMNGMRSFPFGIRLEQESVTVERNYSDDSLFTAGTRLLRINGRDADSLFRSFLVCMSGEQERYRRQSVSQYSSLLLWMHGITAPFTVDAVLSDGSRRSVRSDGATVERKRLVDSLAAPAVSTASYAMRWTDDSVAVIDFRRMSGPEQFRLFLIDAFTQVRDRAAKGVIVDLRENGGGNSQLGDQLLSYITERGYRMADRKEWKMSARYKQRIRERYIPWYLRWFPVTWVSEDARMLLGAEDGAMVVSYGDTTVPPENPLRYTGPVVFLTGVNTFSSAMMTVDAVKEFHLAMIMGEETGGVPSSYGEVYGGELPETGLRYNCSSALWVRANGDASSRTGVVPDIIVPPNSGPGDAAMTAAQRWIGTHKKSH